MPSVKKLVDTDHLTVLRNLDLLDTPPEEAFDRLTGLVARTLHVPISLVSLVTEKYQFFKSAYGLGDLRQTPLSHSFCQHVVESDAPLVVRDARENPMLKDNLAIPDLDVIGYLGMPLTTSDGYTLGSLCAIDTKPHDWTEHEIDVVRELAKLVMREIELREEIRRREQIEEELRQQNEALDAFGHTVAHDLKTPLNNIQAFCSLLREEYGTMPEEQVHEYLGYVTTNVGQMNTIIDGLLRLATVSRTADITLEPLDMYDLLADVQIRLLAEIKDRQAVIHMSDDFPVVLGYRPWVQEVWMNYLSNALKYGGQPPVIRIGADDPDETLNVCCWVQDNGPGMTAEEKSQAFAATTRFHANQATGQGLGLAIVKRIMTRFGGECGVADAPEGGSKFWFMMPAPPSSFSLKRD